MTEEQGNAIIGLLGTISDKLTGIQEQGETILQAVRSFVVSDVFIIGVVLVVGYMIIRGGLRNG